MSVVSELESYVFVQAATGLFPYPDGTLVSSELVHAHLAVSCIQLHFVQIGAILYTTFSRRKSISCETSLLSIDFIPIERISPPR